MTSFLDRFRDLRQQRDPAALYERAQRERVDLGEFRAVQMQKFGLGVPPLWPSTQSSVKPASLPAGAVAFRSVQRPPAAVLWAVVWTGEQIQVSRHVEFVGEIARVAEAVDIEPGGAASSRYRLSLEPARSALEQCLDTAGFGGDTVPYERSSRLRGWFPWRSDAGSQPEPVPDVEQRSFVLRLDCPAGGRPVVADLEQANSDLRLPPDPTRADVVDLLSRFFLGSEQ